MRWLWLCVCLLAAAPLPAQELELARLPAGQFDTAEVLAGRHDDALRPVRGEPVLYHVDRGPIWWQITSRQPVSSAGSPQLVLLSPYDARINAWVPGMDRPSVHALMGPGMDLRYSARALVIDLPDGLSAGQPIWLRVSGGLPMAVSIEPLDEVHRADLTHVAWRTALLSSLALLALLALSFWAGLGERSYGWLAALLTLSLLYLASVGSDARSVPQLGLLLSSRGIGHGAFACLAVATSNIFFRLYLDIQRNLPKVDIWLRLLTVALLVLAVYSVVGHGELLFLLANATMIASAGTVLLVAMHRAMLRQRSAMLLLLSWLPLLVLVVARATELLGYWKAPGWMNDALAMSIAFAALVLTVGQAHKLLQLRRDRDLASSHADVDALTGIRSRRAIERDLHAAIEHAHQHPLSVAWVDIDHFKLINDGHGHQIGDHCLRYVCMRIRGHLRGTDKLGRWGGDELLVLMPETTLDDALARSQRLRHVVDCRPISIDGELEVACSLSLGVAELQPGENASGLLERADRALYASKHGGRNRVRGILGHGHLVEAPDIA